MFDKFFVLATIAIVSIAMTGCSGTKTVSNNNSNAKTGSVSTTAKFGNNKLESDDVPVVYEKRSPTKQQVRARQGNYNNRQASNSFTAKLSDAALGRLRSRVRYDGSYVKIAYPGGDVPQNIGVCTDVVIRSYRKLGIDLQEQVHRDMSAAFNAYPNPRKWGLSRPDTNIDHRRVYNLRQFFSRRGAALPITRNPNNYKPGDLVTWLVGPDLPHIGVVVNRPSRTDPNRLMIVHNIAEGPKMEDVLFRFPITGHYRYTPDHMGNIPQVIYASRKTVPSNNMSYDQLVHAAKLLGTRSSGTQIAQVKQQTVEKSTLDSSLLEQVVNLNSAPRPIINSKNETIKLAKISKSDVETLLGR
jgi:uncharacterized protein YijF (DUF1287 family)